MKQLLALLTLAAGACATQPPAGQTTLAKMPVPSLPPIASAPGAPPSTIATLDPENEFGWNYLASQDSGGVIVQIARVLFGNRAAMPPDFRFDEIELFQDRPVVGEIVFIVENSTPSTVQIYPNEADVLVGAEQINLLEFAFPETQFGDEFSGDIPSGARVIGGIWFGLKRTPLEQINSMTIAFESPGNETSYSLGPDYNFVLDLSIKKHDPIPDELR